MVEVKSADQGNDNVAEGEERFQDAFDEFPFYDCEESFRKQDESDDDGEASSTVSDFALNSKPSAEKSTVGNLRRRRFTSRGYSKSCSSSVSREENYGSSREGMVRFSDELEQVDAENASLFQKLRRLDEDKLDLSGESVEISESERLDKESGSASRISEKLDGIKLNLSSVNSENDQSEGLDEDHKENSIVNNENGDDFSVCGSNLRENHDGDSSFFISFAGLVIKVIGFQFTFLINCITFPIWAIYSWYMFIMDPFRVMKQVREYLFGKLVGLWGSVLGNLSAVVYEWFRQHQSLLKLGMKFAWGFLWSVYVCLVLVGLLVSTFVVGGILINTVVEEPVRISENLNFDYSEKSPLALVPIIGCSSQNCGVECSEKLDVMKLGQVRVIPLDHKLQVTISLKLPESDYNRNLGIFQVRVDFLASDGKILASSRQPCMLQFRSEPIRFLLTLLKVAPLLTGYTSESQDLNIRFRGFIEGVRPTACLRVAIDARAQFAAGAGIPEIYAASLTLESEQPLLKRLLWYWKKTLFIWLSMTMFTVELLFTLLCCKSIIIPRVRLGGDSARDRAPQTSDPLQR